MSERKRSRDFGKRQKIRAILVSAKISRMKKCRLDTRKITAGVESQLLRPDIRMMDWYSISRCQATTAHKISVEDGITRKILPLFQPPPPMQTLVLPIGKGTWKYFFKKKKKKDFTILQPPPFVWMLKASGDLSVFLQFVHQLRNRCRPRALLPRSVTPVDNNQLH